MANKDIKVNDDTNVTLPIRNIIAIIAGVGLAITIYFDLVQQLHEKKMRITVLEHRLERFIDRDFADLYERMAEVEDEISKHHHE